MIVLLIWFVVEDEWIEEGVCEYDIECNQRSSCEGDGFWEESCKVGSGDEKLERWGGFYAYET